MIVSVRLCVILIVLFCVLNGSHSLVTKADLHNDGISGKHDQGWYIRVCLQFSISFKAIHHVYAEMPDPDVLKS